MPKSCTFKWSSNSAYSKKQTAERSTIHYLPPSFASSSVGSVSGGSDWRLDSWWLSTPSASSPAPASSSSFSALDPSPFLVFLQFQPSSLGPLFLSRSLQIFLWVPYNHSSAWCNGLWTKHSASLASWGSWLLCTVFRAESWWLQQAQPNHHVC